MDVQAYTVGKTTGYERALDEEDVVRKLGRHRDYGGGWVWRDRSSAQAFLDQHQMTDFCVYGLLLPNGWATDVSSDPDPSDGVHRLLHDAQIVRV